MKDVIKIFSLPRYLDGRHVSVGCAASSSWGPKLGIYIRNCTLYFTHSFIINPFKWVLTILSQLVVSIKRLHAWPLSLTGCYAVVWMCVAHRSLTPVTSHLTAAKWSSHFTLRSKQWSRPGSALNGPKLESSLHSPLSPFGVFFMSFIVGFKA